MTRLFESLNLRPHERRLVMLAAAVIFIVLNVWLVWPHRNRWRDLNQEISESRAKLERYEGEVARKPDIEAELKELEKGGAMLSSEGEVDLLRTVQTLIYKTGIEVTRQDPGNSSRLGTNDFFVEKSLVLQYQNTRDTNLVNFLIALGKDDSLIRVRELTVRTDANKYKLLGRVGLVASYKKDAKDLKSAGFGATRQP